jgi:hypothetical protein
MRAGTSLRSIEVAHQLRILEQQKASEDVEEVLILNAQSQVNLFTTQSGTNYPIFILGLDNPDDPNKPRWVA